MFLNVEQLEKQLDKEDFQEIGSMAAFKNSIDERVQLKREYDSWVNERQMQTIEEKVDTSKALDASSVDTECSRTESKEQDTSSRSGNDAHDDADIRPIYNEKPMAKVQMTAKIDVFAIGQQHTEQPEFNNEGETIGLRWVPTGRILTSSTTKVDSEPLNGSNVDITNQYECEQTLDVSAVLRYDGDECDKGRMPTKIELTLEQSQQGASNDVLVSIKGVEELKRNVWIKGENKAALQTLKAKPGSIHMLSVFTKVNSGIEDKTSWTQ
nr:hypothetical protein [Tanacetum cinerariifolium]